MIATGLCGCGAGKVTDAAVGGGGRRCRAADLAFDPQGDAMAIWLQFEGGRPDDGTRGNVAVNRFDGATHAWGNAVLAEAASGNATRPRASAAGGDVLLGWIQSEAGAPRVKATLRSLAGAPAP